MASSAHGSPCAGPTNNVMKRLVFTLAAAGILVLGAVAQSSTVRTKQSKLSSIEKQAQALRNKLSEATKDRKNIGLEIQKVDTFAAEMAQAIEDTEGQLRENKAEQEELRKELDLAGAKMTSSKEKVIARIRSMYIQGDASPALVLIGARSPAEFASRKAYLQMIADYDKRIFEDHRALKAQVSNAKQKQDVVVAKIEDLRAKQIEERQRLEKARAEKKAIMAQLKKDEAAIERRLNEMDRESSRLESEIAAYQGRSSRTSSSSYVKPTGGKMLRPVSGGRMSSRFGMRVHPISRRRRMHSGMDIAAPTGTPIRAAKAGRVISAGWRGGYGYTVVIDHGGGVSTLYGHCSRLYVSGGQRVSQGHRIAAVGSTGNSTGPHLHWEVRINGRAVNPANYL